MKIAVIFVAIALAGIFGIGFLDVGPFSGVCAAILRKFFPELGGGGN